MSKKLKATEDKATDVDTKKKRKELAAELGELTFKRAKVLEQLNGINKRCNQIATEMEGLQ